MRPYRDEEDYWRIRAFLREVFLLNDRREFSWPVARLDYWRWHVVENRRALPHIEEHIFLWETADGQLAAVLNPEGPGEAHWQVHPAHAKPALFEEMLDVAEAHFTVEREGQRTLQVWEYEGDEVRQAVLAQRGYTRGKGPEHAYYRAVGATPIPEVPLPPGYCVRSLGERDELPARSWASWRAFHPNEPDEAYEGWEWYHNIQRMPLYRRDLDIVAEAPDGSIAAFCTLWYDDVTRSGMFEPVGTVPEHQRRGLGRAVMTEGLRRLARMGGTLAVVGGFSAAARALYDLVMGADVQLYERWEKSW